MKTTKPVVDGSGHAVVLVDEEYGFRHHLWLTGMTPEKLEEFWASIQNMKDHYTDCTKTLPGTWISVEAEDRTYNKSDLDLWHQCKDDGQYYYAHLHWEDDSSLKAPDGRLIYHAGFEAS